MTYFRNIFTCGKRVKKYKRIRYPKSGAVLLRKSRGTGIKNTHSRVLKNGLYSLACIMW